MKSRVRKIRDEKHLTQQELADLVGVSRQTIHYIEKGDYNPSLILAYRIADVLGTPVNDLFYREAIIKDKLESLSLKKAKQIADDLNISYERIIALSEIEEEQILENFDKAELNNIAKKLGFKFDDLFEAN
ncbi:MAG: transcriptional regulator [Promethearchaeota archaeon]|nr:MAG: transcriptional regulator [Candidatus Lokiarchaeota archaeon]